MRGLKPFSSLYERIAGFKNFLYDRNYLEPWELPVPVLSLGNLTMGGTGKTPLTDLCLKHYQKRQLKVAVVSRNYKAEVREPAEVDWTRPQAAAYFGDEPVLLAERNPQAHFFVGPLKYETAQYAMEKVEPEVVVVDDGFQHRKLHRDFDIVILDATEAFENYACVPEGRAREPWSALARASLFVVTKVNLTTPEKVRELTTRLEAFGRPVVAMSYELQRLCPLFEGEVQNLGTLSGEKVFLISGIAQPRSFEKSLEAHGLQIAGNRIFSDHHPYSASDVDRVLYDWRELGSPRLLTTEKDAVKLKALWPREVPLWYSPLEVQIQSQEEVFYEALDQALL